jgi:catalase
MCTEGNLRRPPTGFPSSRGGWADQPDLKEFALEIEGSAVR